jgi:hypothetical protein
MYDRSDGVFLENGFRGTDVIAVRMAKNEQIDLVVRNKLSDSREAARFAATCVVNH